MYWYYVVFFRLKKKTPDAYLQSCIVLEKVVLSFAIYALPEEGLWTVQTIEHLLVNSNRIFQHPYSDLNDSK